MIERPERGQERRFETGFHQRIDQPALHPVAEHEEERDQEDHVDEGMEPERRGEDIGEEGGEDEKLAVGDVDEAHDAEDHRQASAMQA